MQVTCSGFTPHLGELLMEVLSDPPTDGSKNLDDEEVLFDNVKEKHIRALRSCKCYVMWQRHSVVSNF